MNYILKTIPNRPLVLFLHGWGGDKYSFIDCYNFLSSYDFSVLSIDFQGFGDNPPLCKDYTIFDYAQDLKDLLISLNIKKFYVVCHSFGERVLSIIN
ncbi:MAG: alpha/beta hydrolase, partial [Clostridia bacterium]|nr:alpha/beta hydrolase [Clostridia bacterium]